ncbi:D-amino-acid dehydrogenase [Anaerolineales bacterium]|nr:D-amino-acid dehydrogenase [Anaerolineales bacterium]
MATRKADVLIIGGSSIGLNCAYYLLKSGRQVTIIEANEIARGNASGNAGHIVPSHIIPLAAPGTIGNALRWMLNPKTSPFGMKVSLDPKYLWWLIRFALACSEANVQRAIPPLNSLGQLSARNFSQIIVEENFYCHYQEKGLLFLYKTVKAFEGAKREAELMRRHGIPAEILDKAALHEREPAAQDDVLGGVHFTGDAHLNPALFLKLLGERVRLMGAEVFEHTPVTGFDVTGGKIRTIKTSAGDFEANEIVLAAGAWTPLVARDLKLNIPVQPARGYSLTMSATQAMPRHALLLGERSVAISPMGDLLRLTGRLELSDIDRTVSAKQLAGIERATREYVHLDEKLNIHETWAGLRPTTPDGMPIIGRSPRHNNLVIATGHAMLGLSLGPGTGQVVAELVNGQETAFDLSPLRVGRF